MKICRVIIFFALTLVVCSPTQSVADGKKLGKILTDIVEGGGNSKPKPKSPDAPDGVNPRVRPNPGIGGGGAGNAPDVPDIDAEDLRVSREVAAEGLEAIASGSSKPPFQDANRDPSILPVRVDDPVFADVEINNPKIKPDGTLTGVKERQEVRIPLDRKTVVNEDGSRLTVVPGLEDYVDDITIPKDAEPRITVINHSYYDDFEPNFKLEIRLTGKREYTVGYDPHMPRPIPVISEGKVDLPKGCMLMPKKLYNDIVGDKVEVPDYRLSDDGVIWKLIDGEWVKYMHGHWPYEKP